MELKYAYYVQADPYLSDPAYDMFESYVRERWPDDPRFRLVGYPKKYEKQRRLYVQKV